MTYKRPPILEPLFAPVETLPGVTDKLAPLLRRVTDGPHVVDLLWHLPFSLIDRRLLPSLSAIRTGAMATVIATVEEHRPAHRRGSPYRILVGDGTGSLEIVYFNLSGGYLHKLFPVGATLLISGHAESYNNLLQMAHPDLVTSPDQRDRTTGLRPVYRSTAGLQPSLLEGFVHAAVANAPDLPEWIDGPLVKREQWPSWRQALDLAHHPQSESDLATAALARRRLAYDEILASQLAIAVLRESQRRLPGRPNRGDGSLRRVVLQAFRHPLTNSQAQAGAEIERDMTSDRRMLRLLQGDVGSGKTIVALLAMLAAVESGGQAALMVPTEILARQHWASIAPLCRAAGLEVGLLLGQGRGQQRTGLLKDLANGSVRLVVGTHALLQDKVAFHDLRLAIVDEQHRFGVDNRLDLASKGDAVDTLLMSATPIPRTLTLTQYGDLAVSRLTEKPPGRQPIDTRAVSLDRMQEVVAAVGRRIEAGGRIYWSVRWSRKQKSATSPRPGSARSASKPCSAPGRSAWCMDA